MSSDARWAMALRAARLLAVDPIGLGGATVRAGAGPVRDAWLAAVRGWCDVAAPGAGLPWRRLPPGVGEARLLGGLDLATTLAAGRPVAERGLLAEAHGGILLVPMAERLEGATAGLIAAALDLGEIVVERDGIAARAPARFACLLLDEGLDDERAPGALCDRLAFHLALDGVRPQDGRAVEDQIDMAGARRRLPGVAVDPEIVEAVAATGVAFGVPSLRVAHLALRVARAAAALAGRDSVAAVDLEEAAALVFAPRATCLPEGSSEPDDHDAPPTQPDEPPPPPEEDSGPTDLPDARELADIVLEATRAAIPPALLASLALQATPRAAAAATGRAGVARASAKRGRPVGVRRGLPGPGARLAVVETLRAAAPWQRLRRAATGDTASGRVLVRRDDFRVVRFKQKSETLTLFVVDASGSAALHRLAEVKGAVELILAECYVRRDQVALIAFRGSGAELVLPPTRSLVRAKRALAGQAGGGGTPLAAAVEAAAHVADAARRRGQMPLIVLLTDGKANVARHGRADRAAAEIDALAAARHVRASGLGALVLDIGQRPGQAAARLAAAMGARYMPLPYADAQAVSRIVMAADPRTAGNT